MIALPSVRALAEVVVSTLAYVVAARIIGPDLAIVTKADLEAVTQRGKAPSTEVLDRLRLALS